MNAVALDVGSRTGIVIAEIDFRVAPLVHKAITWPYQGTDFRSSLQLLDIHVGQEMKRQRVQFILLEFPHLLPNMPNYKEMSIVSRIFTEFTEAYRKNLRNVHVTVLNVRPTDWKSTPAVRAKFPKYTLTTSHEKDAYRMLWWFSMYAGNSRETPK